jgi:hypothetical protein
MTNYNSRMPRSSSPTLKNQLLLPIGRHAFIHLPETRAVHGDFTPFGGQPDQIPAKELHDGQEVEIIAWRPMAPQGLSYQVHRLSDHREWWARATCLRATAFAVAAAAE